MTTRQDDGKLYFRYFDVVGPGLFQLTNQDGFCVETEDDDSLAAAMSTQVPVPPTKLVRA